MSLEGEIKDAEMSSFSSDFQTLMRLAIDLVYRAPAKKTNQSGK